MKKNYIIAILTFFGLSTIWSESNRLFAQDKQADFNIGKGNTVYSIESCGEDEFYVIYGDKPSAFGGLVSKFHTMKFDKNLKPAWTNPISIKVGNSSCDFIYSYTNPADKKTTSYLYDVSIVSYMQGVTGVIGPVGQGEFLQVLQDGTTKAKETEIPKKELQNLVAVFADINGLNIITLNGDKEYPTGKMNWYVYSHDQLKMTKKNIVLPLPPRIDKEYSADWWLNQVSSDGLYFSYISYKNKKAKESGSILTCYVIKVNTEGKPGNIINIDMNCDKYNMVPACYTRKSFLSVSGGPSFFVDWRHSPDFNVFLPHLKKYVNNISTSNDFALLDVMGVRVDENNNRIYTIIALNDEIKVDRDGNPEAMSQGLTGASYPIKSFKAAAYDMAGKKINQAIVDCKQLAADPGGTMGGTDNKSYDANNVNLTLLQNNEGIVYKAISNGNGCIFLLNKDGEIEKQSKFELFSYKAHMVKSYKDIYPAFYTTIKDFETSPYMNIKSPEVQFFNKTKGDSKPNASYLSLKSGDIFAILDSKNDVVKFSYFNKK